MSGEAGARHPFRTQRLGFELRSAPAVHGMPHRGRPGSGVRSHLCREPGFSPHGLLATAAGHRRHGGDAEASRKPHCTRRRTSLHFYAQLKKQAAPTAFLLQPGSQTKAVRTRSRARSCVRTHRARAHACGSHFHQSGAIMATACRRPLSPCRLQVATPHRRRRYTPARYTPACTLVQSEPGRGLRTPSPKTQLNSRSTARGESSPAARCRPRLVSSRAGPAAHGCRLH